MANLKVSVVQLNCNDDWPRNFEQIKHYLNQALDEQAQYILLPENAALYGGQYAQQLANEGEQHPLLQYCQDFCQSNKVAITIGSHPVANENSLPFTTSISFNNLGERLSDYHKIHLFKADVADAQGSYDEGKVFSPGSNAIVHQIAGFNIGMSICYDLRFPSLYQHLRALGAQVLTVPAAFTKVTGEAHWLTLLRARAIETGCFVLAANQCGQHNANRASYGHSMIISPWGEVIAEMADEPGVIFAELDMEVLLQVRQNMPSFDNQRSFK